MTEIRPQIAISKSGLDSNQITALTDKNSVRSIISNNLEVVKDAPMFREKQGIFELESVADQFTLNGALKIDDLQDLGVEGRDFFTSREGRYLLNGKKYILRGPRYIVAADSNLSVPQQLVELREDYGDGIDILKGIHVEHEQQYYRYAPVLDYLNSAAITAFNAYIYREKVGDLQLDNASYQSKRRNLIS